MLKYITPLLVLLFIGCNSTPKSTNTFFGGKIINPKSKFIILSNYNEFTDTIALAKDNTFLASYKNFKEGLYYFKHGPEHQYVYIEPKDSILIRLNTWDFDESLVFSGDNAIKNNTLIAHFLQNEKDKKIFYKNAFVSPSLFKIKADSILNKKKEIFIAYKNKYPKTSERFLNLLDITLTYQTYSKLEKYGIRECLAQKKDSISSNFFDYRKNTTRTLDSLMFFYPYYEYVINSIYHDVYKKGISKNPENLALELLHTIHKDIKNEKVKNQLLFNTTVKHFFSETCDSNSKKTLYTFFKLSSCNNDKKEIQRLLNDTKNLKQGNRLPNFKIQNSLGKTISINKLTAHKNSVIYFRNHKSSSNEYVASRINFLAKKHPKINFLIINTCGNLKCYTNNISLSKQLFLPKKSSAAHFLSSKFSRMLLINKKGIITNSYSSLSSSNLEKQISDLEK